MQLESRTSGASSSLSSTWPNFTRYSSEKLADIAARVLHELNLSQNDLYDDDFSYSSLHQNDAFKSVNDTNDNNEDDAESEFEFAVISGDDVSPIITADEIFYNGQIKPIYPVFNTNLVNGYRNDGVSEDGSKTASEDSETTTLRLSLRKEREKGNDGVLSCSSNDSVSSSSSDDDELEGVPQGSYCTWAPKKKNNEKEEEKLVLKKKSKSTGTGSPKRWRIKDLINRSNSDGKENTFALLKMLHQHHGETKRRENNNSIYSYYNNNGGKKMEGKKMKSYLPYRQDLLGFSIMSTGFH